MFAIGWVCALWLSEPAPALSQVKVSSGFRTGTESGWTITGTDNTGNNDSGILTGGYGAVTATNTNDPVGDGWLRLTTDSNNQVGKALLTGGSTLPSTFGVIVEFDYVSWGGTGADGISMFLYDATQNMAGAANGAGLGYCRGAGGYLGVGLDEFGNFSAVGAANTNFCLTGTPGVQPDRVVVRGPVSQNNPVIGSAAVAGLDTPSVTTRPGFRRVRVMLLPNGTSGYRVTVMQSPVGGGAMTTLLDALNFPHVAPANLRLGFGGSTGGSTNIHEIRGLTASSPADIVVTKTVSAATVLRGAPVSYVVTVRNNDINASDPGDQSPAISSANAPDIADNFPAQLADVSWTCTASAGSTCPAASGTGNITFANGYTLASGGQLTFEVNATVATTAACGATVTNTASADFAATDNLADINPANNTASANFNVVCPQLTVRKISQGGVGTFAFTGDNGIQNHSIATTTAGTAVSGPAQALLAAGAATTITEASVPAGFVLSDAACTGIGTNGTVTVDLANRQIVLDTAATRTAGPIVCTFTNLLVQADLSITKTNTPGVNNDIDQANDTLTAGAITSYRLVVRNAGPAAAHGAVVRDTPVSRLTGCAVNACTAAGGAACPAVPANLLTTGGAVIPTLPANGTVTFALSCTVN